MFKLMIIKILLWNDPVNDILGITSNLEKVVAAMEELLLDTSLSLSLKNNRRSTLTFLRWS